MPAPPVFWSAELLANTTTANNQFAASVGALEGGGFVVAWQDLSLLGGDASIASIKAQRFNAFGEKIGSEFLVNTNTEGVQYQPSVIGLAGGGFLVTWSTSSFPTDEFGGVAGRIYGASGQPTGSEFLINSVGGPLNYSETSSKSAALSSGGFVTVYQRLEINSVEHDIVLQRFDSAGQKVGAETVVNATTANDQSNVNVASIGGGKFAVVWQDFNPAPDDNSGTSIRMRIYTDAGATSGVDLLVNTATNNEQQFPAIAADDAGNFLVVFRDFSQELDSSLVLVGQRFDANGTKIGDDFIVNDTLNGGGGPDPAAITYNNDGTYLVTWTEFFGGVNIAFAQLLAADGTKIGGEFQLNTTPVGTFAEKADVVSLADGRSVAVWHQDQDAGVVGGDASGTSVRVQILDSRGGMIFGTESSEIITGSKQGTAAVDSVRGFGGNDKIYSFDGNDFIDGGDGNDVLEGGTGDDDMTGGTGSDIYYVDSLLDIVREETGSANGTQDTIISTVAVRLDITTTAQGIEHAALQGAANVAAVGHNTFNTLTGNTGNNYLAAYGGNDTVSGGAGNDTIFGGEGKDTLTGGTGNDRFYYNFIAESGGTQARRDVITDFSQVAGNDDWIDLAATDANGAVAGNQAFVFIGTAAFTGAAGELRYFQDAANNRTIIEGNVRVDAASPGAEFSLELTGLFTLTAGATNAFDIIL